MKSIIIQPLPHRSPVKVLKEDLTWISGHVVGRCKPVGQEYHYDVKVKADDHGEWILPNVPAQRVYPPDVGPKSAA